MVRKGKSREWAVIIAIAVLLHVLLFVSIRPSFFAAFKREISANSGDRQAPASTPHAIVTIPIEIEEVPEDESEQDPVQENVEMPTQIENEPDNAVENHTSHDENSRDALDLESLPGNSPQALPHGNRSEGVAIPPRPIEITWPDTRGLKHCLGNQIDINIQVAKDGTILAVEPMAGDHPPDCLQAAVESARRIVFQPGMVDGRPAEMWTTVRIDFRRKK